MDSVVCGCIDGSEVRWAAWGPDARGPASQYTSRPTVGRLAAAFFIVAGLLTGQNKKDAASIERCYT